ncbi:DNA -binding domain-containing protein [Bradyrhizobium sp. Pa8]|uniref:DNA -binding domain-containing protein n=1 Tax=Bradyrhizobium sp. Pa8 TaxID=3386552 RepID=UPI00403F58F3
MTNPISHSRRDAGDNIAACNLVAYDGSDWAWEFLRRNEDYKADWRSSVPRHLPCITLIDGTRLLRLPRRFPRAEKWGLSAFADPRLGAHQAPVFWHANALKRIVRVNATRPTPESKTASLTLANFRVDRHAVIGVDGVPLVLMKGGGVHVPIAIHGLRVLTLPFAPVFELNDLADIVAQTELLKQLKRFAEPSFQKEQRPPFANDERLQHALIALDESLRGKTYREIAMTIFGEKKVTEDWRSHSQFLKDRTRRLVAKGTELMKGGYRDLLG